METPISNSSVLNGTYSTDELEVFSTTADVTLVEGLEATKVADRVFWANGELQYTVTVTNETAEDYVTPTFVDELDPLMVLVDGSFKVDDESYAHTFDNNTIEATLPTISAGGSLTITFLVRKA